MNIRLYLVIITTYKLIELNCLYIEKKFRACFQILNTLHMVNMYTTVRTTVVVIS